MDKTVTVVRSGFDFNKCLVHARCCVANQIMLATAQYLDVGGCDLFSGILSSISTDNGKTWSEFKFEKGLQPLKKDGVITVPCDATPMFHKKTGKIILLGHTAEYVEGGKKPTGKHRYTLYSVFDEEQRCFSKMKFLQMPEGFDRCGNGSGQSIELENGDLIVPAYYAVDGQKNMRATVLHCSFDGKELKLIEMGNSLTIPVKRGLCEPSLIVYDGVYYMTLRNDECAMVAISQDGLNYADLQHWKWDDGSLIDSYNTQQHWMMVNNKLYLVYTRRAGNNDHVFRHRAPLFAARVEDMKLVRDSEFIVIGERGARLGNFGVVSLEDGSAFVMAAEWMQPSGCEKYGSDNAIFVAHIKI